MGTAEQRLDGAVAYRALVRYDAYGEMSGRQSTSIALLDATRSGVVLSSIHHRDQARLYAKQVREGQAELELSPEENEAIRLALEGDAPAPRPRSRQRAMRVGYFGPEGTFTHEALIDASARRPRARARSRCPTIYDTVMAVHAGAVERALVPIENSLEGSVNATLDALAMETDDVAIVGEVVHPIRHCLIARTRARARGDRDRRLASPGHRPVRALHPHAAAGSRVLAGSSTADAVRMVAEHDGPWAALGNRLAAERYGCHVLRAGVEDVADNETRFVWLGPVGRAAGRARARRRAARPVEDGDRVLGGRLRGAGLARALPGGVRRRARST